MVKSGRVLKKWGAITLASLALSLVLVQLGITNESYSSDSIAGMDQASFPYGVALTPSQRRRI